MGSGESRGQWLGNVAWPDMAATAGTIRSSILYRISVYYSVSRCMYGFQCLHIRGWASLVIPRVRVTIASIDPGPICQRNMLETSGAATLRSLI